MQDFLCTTTRCIEFKIVRYAEGSTNHFTPRQAPVTPLMPGAHGAERAAALVAEKSFNLIKFDIRGVEYESATARKNVGLSYVAREEEVEEEGDAERIRRAVASR
uniref:Methyltransferase FkbM domain-containing protein n=1 Tax=Trichogramma kaykai TaxID=54128 RepID=A0ABD2X2L2_9HYME